MDLNGKTIVITGAARGLGQSMAEVVARQGADLALVDLDEADLQETARLCAQAGVNAKSYGANVAEEAAVESLFAKVREDFGRVDGLINNAGTNRDALLVKVKDGEVLGKMSLADFNTVIAVDLVGVFLCGREAAVHMIEGGRGGVIINISSISRHPIGATGAVLATRLAHSMQRDNIKRGVVTLCIGGGQGIALALESLH
jgi:3-oxoacyl-[acyl-carrier protein] reductase